MTRGVLMSRFSYFIFLILRLSTSRTVNLWFLYLIISLRLGISPFISSMSPASVSASPSTSSKHSSSELVILRKSLSRVEASNM